MKIPTQELFEKIIWFLNKFKSDGRKIIINNKNLDKLEKIINIKSRNSIKVDKDSILSPCIELSRDIC